ncbi:MAG: MBL fold metallo-hydrolase [Saprospiraceae bacterium]|nr:MBL fold metallo-hydrolase [Saprospiraceae bacterium]
MNIKFCGAAKYVTGSSHLVTLDNGYKILLDCGLFQGRGEELWMWNNEWLFDPKEIDCVILSHAHIDHSGRLPKLVKDGFTGRVICTYATRSLCGVMLLDSAKIQESDVEYHNANILKKRKKDFKKIRQPLYTEGDTMIALSHLDGYAYEQWIKINPSVSVYFTDAGHILGSATVSLRIRENGKTKTLGFTGDIGRPNRPILKDPKPMPRVDYLICESTYGDRVHESEPEQNNRFLEIIKKTCVDKKGKLIIPAFSLGRTQELVFMLDKMENQGLLPHIPVIVDSPLSVNVTAIYRDHPECFNHELKEYLKHDDNPFGFNKLSYVKDVNESKMLNTAKNPMIIISAAGMINAGRIKHHLFNNIENPKNTFLIVGYCTPETLGGQLRSGAKTVNIFFEEKQVLADVEIMDSFSAHGDKNEMADFISNQKGRVRKIFLVHGEEDTQNSFKYFLGTKGFKNIHIPFKGETVVI